MNTPSVIMYLAALPIDPLVLLRESCLGRGGQYLVAQPALNGSRKTAALEEQKNESAEEVDAEDESNSSETKAEVAELDSKSDGIDEKPDMNDVLEKEKVIA
ncbi:hypothetical protein ACET3Z_001925 [Daucus carota]